MAEFVLEVHDIDETGKAYDFAVRRAWLAEIVGDMGLRVPAAVPEGRLTIEARRQGEDVVVLGRLSASMVTECARCLEDATISIDSEVGGLLTARGSALRAEPDEAELTPEEISRDFFTGDRIILDDMIREHLLLEVPIKPLCQDDCAGIPVPEAVSGPDLTSTEDTIDPRLAPLLSLVGRVKPTEE